MFGAFALAIVTIPMFAAFEAHVINVTAMIENALSVAPREIAYGTVFPQEELDRPVNIEFSRSFTDEITADDVNYVIKQKPKCILVTQSTVLPKYGRVTEDVGGNFVCEDETNYDILPVLCPYLSKHEITQEPVENDSAGINAFHGLPGLWTSTTTALTAVSGRLAKSESDALDTWNIDLRVPCFEGTCSQDWDAFVLENNLGANPADYIQPAAMESKLFGCDLWIEVTGVSRRPQ